MKNDLFTIALKDGLYISINEFQSGIGKECGCTCPECGESVQSNVTSKSLVELKRNYTNHFSHSNSNSKCNGGYKETELHLFAKKLFEQNQFLKVPTEKYHYPRSLQYNNVRIEPAFPVQEYKQYRPDIIISTLEGDISIEVFVTNPLSNAKKELYRNNKKRCITIDLSVYRKKKLDECKQQVELEILEKVEYKKWIWPDVLQEFDEPVIIATLKSENNTTNSQPSDDNLIRWFWVSLVGISLFILACFFKSKNRK